MAVPKHASTLRQLFVVFRHGDRSPAFNPLEGTTEAAAHATHWAQAAAKLPSGYCNKFPVDNVNAQTFDAPHAPFQTLTHRGATELRLRGLNLVSLFSKLATSSQRLPPDCGTAGLKRICIGDALTLVLQGVEIIASIRDCLGGMTHCMLRIAGQGIRDVHCHSVRTFQRQTANRRSRF